MIPKGRAYIAGAELGLFIYRHWAAFRDLLVRGYYGFVGFWIGFWIGLSTPDVAEQTITSYEKEEARKRAQEQIAMAEAVRRQAEEQFALAVVQKALKPAVNSDLDKIQIDVEPPSNSATA